jgi:hypothetical protein
MTPETVVACAAAVRDSSATAAATAFQSNLARTNSDYRNATFGSNHLRALHSLGLAELNERVAANTARIVEAHNKKLAPPGDEYRIKFKNWISTCAAEDREWIDAQIGIVPKGYGDAPEPAHIKDDELAAAFKVASIQIDTAIDALRYDRVELVVRWVKRTGVAVYTAGKAYVTFSH